jgi:hypothetical protein
LHLSHSIIISQHDKSTHTDIVWAL